MLYIRLRGLPKLDGSPVSHSLLNHPAFWSLNRMGYKVPDGIRVAFEISAPEIPDIGEPKSSARTLRVGPVMRGVSLLIVESLHRVRKSVYF